MSCDWEGNRGSGAALAMRHRRKWFIHLRAQGLSKGHEHLTNAAVLMGYGTVYFLHTTSLPCGTIPPQFYVLKRHVNREFPVVIGTPPIVQLTVTNDGLMTDK